VLTTKGRQPHRDGDRVQLPDPGEP